MSLKIPDEIKYITPYVQRGQEVAARDPVVSYYGRNLDRHASSPRLSKHFFV